MGTEDAYEIQRRSEWIDTAREIVEFLDDHGELIPYSPLQVLLVAGDGAEFAAKVRLLGRAEKGVDSYGPKAERRFGSHSIQVYAAHTAVCERVVVGTREIEKPDPDAPKVMVTEDVVEWVCPPSFLAAGTDTP